MKRVQLHLTLCALLLTTLASAQIPNSGFEQWNTNTLFENLDDYATSSLTTYIEDGSSNVTQVNGASGNAARLETTIVSGDTVGGFIANDLNLFRGTPFIGQPDSVRITARYNIAAGDTASIIFWFKRNGFPFAFVENFVVINGQENNFVTFTRPLNVPLPPDSLYFIASSSNLFGDPVAGSWLEIDDITFVNSTEQLPNNNMENWTPVELTEPEGWGTTNLISSIFSGPTTVREITGNNGSAAQIEVVEINAFGNIDTFGFMANELDFFSDGEPGSPYTDQPEKLTFNYRYAPQGNDQAVVYVVFSKWNAAQQERDSINGGLVYLNAAANWTSGEIAFDWTGKPLPDTISVIAGAGEFFAGTAVPGSILDIDDLALAFPTGRSLPLLAQKPVRLFPNPAKSQITIQLSEEIGSGATLRIYDVLGRVVYELQLTDQLTHTLPIQGWAKGTYLYDIRKDEQHYFGKFVKQ